MRESGKRGNGETERAKKCNERQPMAREQEREGGWTERGCLGGRKIVTQERKVTERRRERE